MDGVRKFPLYIHLPTQTRWHYRRYTYIQSRFSKQQIKEEE